MFHSQCQVAHEKIVAGKCPWCGQAIFNGRLWPPDWTMESRTLCFEFHGGFMDGQTSSGVPSDQGAASPSFRRFLYLTDGGRMGAKFDEFPQYAGKLENDVWDEMRKALDAKDSHTAHALFNKLNVGRVGQATYEVTQRVERSNDILVRLEMVESDG
jgi:hypothetical protein